jgi:hypothetical protein
MSSQNKQAHGIYDMTNLLSSLCEIEAKTSSSVRDIYDMTNLISELLLYLHRRNQTHKHMRVCLVTFPFLTHILCQNRICSSNKGSVQFLATLFTHWVFN